MIEAKCIPDEREDGKKCKELHVRDGGLGLGRLVGL
jgi:hypothetical protein